MRKVRGASLRGVHAVLRHQRLQRPQATSKEHILTGDCGSTQLWFRSWSCCCNLSLGVGGLVCCYGRVKLHTCSWWSTQLSVLLILRRRVHTLPRPWRYVTNCSARVQHGLCGHWSSKQHQQCTKLHCRRRQLLRCGLRCGRWWR